MIVGEKTIGGKHGGWHRALGALKAWLVANGWRWFNGSRKERLKTVPDVPNVPSLR